jgi:NOL1/NOP2/fmu family ribosome biogenesis protein
MISKCSPQDQEKVLNYFEYRFGIPRQLFEDFSFYSASKGRVYIGPKNLIEKPKPVTGGILVARISRHIKPTTNFFQFFGKNATKNMIELNKEHTISLIQGENLDLNYNEVQDASNGYVLITYLDFPIGCGLLKDNHLRNMIPRPKLLDLEFL